MAELDSLAVFLKLADLGLAALAIGALALTLQVLNKLVDRLEDLLRTDQEQTEAINTLTQEVRGLSRQEG